MSEPHILVDLNETCRSIINFIGSDKFNEVVSSIENSARAGFMTGLSFAMSLAMSEGKTFLYHVDEQKKEE